MSRILSAPIPVVIILLVSAASLLFLAARDTQAVTFNPFSEACLEDDTTGADCDGSNQAGANSDVKTLFGMNAPDSNFGGVVTFIPTAFGVPPSTEVPIGAVTGRLKADVQLGLLNAPCNSKLTVRFTLLNASINTAVTIKPRPPGQANVLEPLMQDADNNGIPDGADKWPLFLTELFNQVSPQDIRARQIGTTIVSDTVVVLQFLVFEPGTDLPSNIAPVPDIDPSLGYPTVTVLQDPTAPPAQSNISDFCTPLRSQNLTFGLSRDNPCTPAPGPVERGCPGEPPPTCGIGARGADKVDDDGDGVVNDGCPQVGSIADPDCSNDISDDPEDPDINDGCPQVGDTSEAFIPDPDGCDGDSNEASCAVRANPSTPGTYTVTVKTASQRDFDKDGHENSLDVCWNMPNAEWEPRDTDSTNDKDNDGLPNICDPNPGQPQLQQPVGCPAELGNTGFDEDLDCFSNRQDNCPVNANPNEDTDFDGIGDACDTAANGTKGPTVPDGEREEVTLTTSVTITATGDGGGGDGDGGGGDGGGGDGDTGVLGTDGTGGAGGGAGGPAGTGVGSLAPVASSIPTWAAIASGLGGAGLLSSLAAMASRILRRRRQ